MAKWVKPTIETKFHIEIEWWEEQGRNFRTHLLSHLCADHQERYREYDEAELIDWIDVETAEVTQVDGLWHSLRTCCSLKPDYANERTPLTTAVFRVFLANGNLPLTSIELGEILKRDPGTILRTIGGFRVYNGIKPTQKSKRRRALA